MTGKIAHFLLLLNSVLLHFGTGETLFTVNGIVNGSVTLPSGSPYDSISEVRWRIDRTVIAFYLEPDIVTTDTKRFGDRLRLYKKDGSLLINRAQMGDADTYNVTVSQGKSKHNAVVKLMIYERADTPILEVLTNTSGPRFCNVSVRCSTLHGLWVESLCQLTQGKLVCQETARNDSAHSARLLITAIRDAINCSSSNPARTSSAPLLPVTQVCPAPVPDPEKKPDHTQLLQVFGVHGTSLVLDGAVGESIVLPTDEEGPIRGPGFMQWKKNNIDVIQLVREQDSSPFETRVPNAAFKGRLIVNYETGALTISSLREEDSGEYVFTGLRSSVSLRPKTIQLHIYERIVSVQVTSQVNNSTDGTSCNVILSCSVIGGSQVALSWSRNGENIAGAENRTTLTVSPTRAEEDYTCTASNPISSQSSTTRPCQTGTGEALITVNGIVNESVTLPSGSPYTSPSEVQWTIGKSVIAFYLEPSFVITDTKRFEDRSHLNTKDGSLQINRAQMGDGDTYTVAVSQGKSKHKAEVKLMIYEQADTPILEVLTNTSGPQFCNVSVRCATLQGLWVASLCQLTQGKLVCQETARNDSAHSARLLITATRDAINCSSSNPASTSSAPLLPVKQVCPAPVPGKE